MVLFSTCLYDMDYIPVNEVNVMLLIKNTSWLIYTKYTRKLSSSSLCYIAISSDMKFNLIIHREWYVDQTTISTPYIFQWSIHHKYLTKTLIHIIFLNNTHIYFFFNKAHNWRKHLLNFLMCEYKNIYKSVLVPMVCVCFIYKISKESDHSNKLQREILHVSPCGFGY